MVPVLVADSIAVLFLVVLLIQDIKYRMIAAWALFGLVAVIGFKAVYHLGYTDAMLSVVRNAGLLLIQGMGLVAFYFLKDRSISGILNRRIGTGDLLFLLAITPAFSLLNFMFYYLLGLFATLIGYGIYRFFYPKGGKEIPLAGSLSFILILFIFFQYLDIGFDPYDDSYIIGLLY